MTGIPESKTRIAVLGCGNPSRGHDALGPILLERVEEWTRAHPGRPVVVAQDFQFQGGQVTFEDVDFSYVVGRKILKHNTFEAQPGQTICDALPSQ